MSRKIIDIGTVGNDGTGDSIRESFRKVNDNFRELYSSLGLGERLQFTGLSDTPNSFTGFENSIITVNSTEDGVSFRELNAGVGVNVDFTTDPTKITINAEFASVSGDDDPQLGGDLSAQSGGQQYRIFDLGTDEEPIDPIFDHEAINKSYADKKISLAGIETVDPVSGDVEPSQGIMTGPLVLSRSPVAEDDVLYDGLVAATKSYVDNSAFGSSVNLYVATSGADFRPDIDDRLKGRALAYAYRSIEAALNKAEEILLEAPVEIGPYKKTLTFNDGAENVTLAGIEASPDSGTGFAGTAFLSVDSVELSANFSGINYRTGDILTLTGGTFIEPAQFEVLSTRTNPGQIINLRVISTGRYTVVPGSEEIGTTVNRGIGTNAKVDVTYNVNSVEVTNGGSGYGLVSVRVDPSDGNGTGAFGQATIVGGVITGITITNNGSGFTTTPNLFVDLPRFLLRTDNFGTDFTGDINTDTPAAVATRDLREGLFLRGETSGAIAQILAHNGSLDSDGNEIFDVDIKSGAFITDEVISYGDVARSTQISVLIESGIYEENLPLRIPQNVAIIGNEFRRVLVRPKPGTSSSPYAFLNFKRPLEVDGNTVATQPFGYHYLTDSTEPVYPLINNRGAYTASSSLLRLNKKFLIKEVIAWLENQVANTVDPFDLTFTYDDNAIEEDLTAIIDAISFDLLYGGQDRTISTALKFKDKSIGLNGTSGDNDEVTAIIERLFILSQLVIQNVPITELYGSTTVNPQVIDFAFSTESGVGGSTVNISDISNLEPLVVTTAAPHNFADEQNVVISDVLGMGEVNGNDFFVKVLSPDTFYLYNTREDIAEDNASGVPNNALDGTNFGEYTGSGTVTDNNGIIGDFFDALIDIITGSGTFNSPLLNEEMDIFLCNDATIIRAVTGQGHGGFMMVLDPEGQILAKSPYCQESASFSRSTGSKTFAGGMFVDGFTGNLQFQIDQDLDGDGTRLLVSKLQRFPQLPASFIVNDTVYRINYIRNFIYSTTGSSAEFVIDDGGPYLGTLGLVDITLTLADPGVFTTSIDHNLEVGATVQFTTTGSLPSEIQTNRDYYVVTSNFTDTTFSVSETPGGSPIALSGSPSGTHKFRRIFEVLMPGNRSMLSNDYTQVNDLGYGLIATNGGLTEAVSMFTYYNEISYLSLNGGQIRSLGGSSAHGNFALVAEGSDPLEIPVPVKLYHELTQGGTVINEDGITENLDEGLLLFVEYDDYFPLPGTEIEIDQNGLLTRYSTSTSQMVDEERKLVRMNISSSGGLQGAIPNGTRITLRQNTFVVLTGDVVDVSTRPSTALVLQDSPFIYRILDFSDYDDAYDFDNFEATITAASEAVITTSVPHRQQAGYQIEFITDGSLPDPIDEVTVYYVLADGLTDTSFKIATSPDGTPVDTNGSTQSGTHTVVPYGLALTQLRSNYDYIEFNIKENQPFQNPSSLTACTVSTGTPGDINANGHGLVPGDQIKFTADTMPEGLVAGRYYWVSTNGYTTNSFRVSIRPPIESFYLGRDCALSGNTVSGIKNTSNIEADDLLIPKVDIDNINITGNGTTATATFTKRQLPPYNPQQSIAITNGGAFNGAHTVLTCTNNSFTFSTATTGSVTGATSGVAITGDLGTDPTVLNVPTSTTITISATTPSDGSVVFDVEAPPVAISTSGSNLQFGKVIGDQGTTTVAVEDVSAADELRLQSGISGTPYEFTFYGDTYQVLDYENSSETGEGYALLTVDSGFDTSIVDYPDPQTFKVGLGVPSTQSVGTLTIRISLTRATSHDFLEIGTGSYADTNYPNEIFGAAVNSFRGVPTFATDEDEDGNTISRSQVQERSSGRVFFVSTDQFGNFSVGPFFRVDQGTGAVTFSASLALSQLDGLGFKRGAVISEFSVDDTFADGAADSVPTESAVRGYIDKRLGLTHTGNTVLPGQIIPSSGGFMSLGGQLSMNANMDIGSNRIINLSDPVDPNDAVNLQSLTLENFVDVAIGEPKGADLFVFTGVGDQFTNGEVVGDIDLSLDSTAFTVSAQINPEVITNAEISPSADISQSKLVLNLSETRSSSPTGTDAEKQALSGLSSFDETAFTVVDGYVSLKSNGTTLGNIQQLASDTVIGNSSGATATPTEVSFATIVNEGLALKKSNFTDLGFIRRKNVSTPNGDTGVGIGTSYEMVDSSSSNNPSTLVFRDNQGNFAGEDISASKFILDGVRFADTFTSGGVGVVSLYGTENNAHIQLQTGALNEDKINFYDNESHIFRPQNGIGNAPIICSSITSQNLTTGDAETSGSVEGRWFLTTGSRFEATYADLAEYYQGDKTYDAGTVLIFGGEFEVTETNQYSDSRIAGVVSENPAYVMNHDCPGHKVCIALQGRVPCKVVGKIRKGDLLTSSEIPGICTKSLDPKLGTIVGKALQDYDEDGIGMIEVAVGRA